MDIKETIQKLLELMTLNEPSVDLDLENKKAAIFINEGEWFKKWIPQLINDIEHILRLVARRNNLNPIFVDINNYRKERENIIIELAKAAARKSNLNKEEVALPPMNAYERRLVHLELSSRPDIKTESVGEAKERHVVIKPIL
jgi:spoIIIJ-associated protein